LKITECQRYQDTTGKVCSGSLCVWVQTTVE